MSLCQLSDDEFKLFWDSAYTLRELAEKFDVSRQAVSYRARCQGLPKRSKERWCVDRKLILKMMRMNPSSSAQEIAVHANCSRTTVWAVLRKAHVKRRIKCVVCGDSIRHGRHCRQHSKSISRVRKLGDDARRFINNLGFERWGFCTVCGQRAIAPNSHACAKHGGLWRRLAYSSLRCDYTLRDYVRRQEVL